MIGLRPAPRLRGAGVAAWLAVAAAVLAWCPAEPAAAQDTPADAAPAAANVARSTEPVASPSGATVVPNRLVKLYDFEDTDDAGLKIGESLSHAPDWYPIGRDPQESDPAFLRQRLHEQLAGRRHYPAFNEVRMDNAEARSGQYAMHLQLRGGNVGAFTEVGSIPVVPGSDYVVSAFVLTRKLDHAGARVTAYLLDAAGRPIPGTRRDTGPVRTEGRWDRVTLALPGEERRAAWIALEIEVAQPTARPDHPLGEEQVIIPDIAGGAWFDDIAVWQVPSVRISTQSEVNIIRAPDAPKLSVAVRDLAGRGLVAKATIYDERMRPVLHEQRPVGAGSPGSWTWEPKLPGYGWYRVELVAQETQGPSAGQVLARAAGVFLYLPPKQAMWAGDRNRFGVIAEGADERELAVLADLLAASSLHTVTLSAFNPQATLGDFEAKQSTIDAAIERLLMRGRHVTLSLDPVPSELTQSVGLDVADAIAAMHKEPDRFLAYLTPVIMRHGQRVRRWQMGSAAAPDAFFNPRLRQATADLADTMHRLAPEPQLVLPWSLDQSRRDAVPAEFEHAARVPASVVPSELSAYLEGWQSPPAALALELDAPPADRVPQHQRVRDLALRILYAWEHQPAALTLRRPWTTAGARTPGLVPDPRLGVLTTVGHRLAGRRVTGRLAVAPGIECMILDGERGGMLAVWNQNAEPGTTLSMYLGPEPQASDLWGNPIDLPQTRGRHTLVIPKTPVFIEGIDAKLAQFRASLSISDPFIESRQGRHPRTLSLTNPFDRTISGKLTIHGPEGWTITPRAHFFSIAAGKTVELPVALSFPISEIAGHKELVARAQFRAVENYDIELTTPLELGLPGIDFNSSLALVEGQTPGTTDAVVSAVVTNTGDAEVALYVFASLSGHPRTERSIPSLEPGQSAVRTFRFTDVGDALDQYPVRTGVREHNGPAMLNHLLRAGDE